MSRAARLAAALAGILAAAPVPTHAQSTQTVIESSGDDAVVLRGARHERPRYVAPSFRPPSYAAGTGIVPPLVDTYTPAERSLPSPYLHPYRQRPVVVVVERPIAPPAGPGIGGHRAPPPVAAAGPRH